VSARPRLRRNPQLQDTIHDTGPVARRNPLS